MCQLALTGMCDSLRIKCNSMAVLRARTWCSNVLYHNLIHFCCTHLHVFPQPKKNNFAPEICSEKRTTLDPRWNKSSFQAGWNTILIWCSRPHQRNNLHRASVSMLPWNIELMLNLDSKEPTLALTLCVPKRLFYMCIISPWKRWIFTWSVISCFQLAASFRWRARPRHLMFYEALNWLLRQIIEEKETLSHRRPGLTPLHRFNWPQTYSHKRWRPSVSFTPAPRMKGLSNINVQIFLLHTPNLKRGELLNVFGNDTVKASDIYPRCSNPDQTVVLLWACFISHISSTIHECVTLSAGMYKTKYYDGTVMSSVFLQRQKFNSMTR